MFKPGKKLKRILKKKSGRNFTGKITTRHQGGRQKRFLREVDFKRSKREVPAKVVSIEYDPNRGANVALLVYLDGEKRYILAPEGLKVGSQVVAGEKAGLEIGNALPLKKIPVAIFIVKSVKAMPLPLRFISILGLAPKKNFLIFIPILLK